MDKVKILYVDDEPVNLKLFEVILQKKYHVLTASDGFEGLKVVNQNNDIKVILSDMKMPNMSGIQFIYKAVELSPDSYYYVLTGFDVSDEISDAINRGIIKKYFRKPFNINEISLEIESVLSKN
ncbi:MAG: response regulator [Draconibacterium sp.]